MVFDNTTKNSLVLNGVEFKTFTGFPKGLKVHIINKSCLTREGKDAVAKVGDINILSIDNIRNFYEQR